MRKRPAKMVKRVNKIANSLRVGKAFGNKPEELEKDHAAWYLQAALQSDLSNKAIYNLIEMAEKWPTLFVYSVQQEKPRGI